MAEGELIHCVVRGPVVGALPQTPQAGEQVAMAQLCQYLRRPTVVFADCMASITLANKQPKAQLDPRCMYAGCRKWAMGMPGFRHFRKAVHVKAHMAKRVMEDLEPEQKRRALANVAADTAAKEARLAHPQPDEALRRAMDADVNRLSIVYRVAAGVLSMFPKVQYERMPKASRLDRRKVAIDTSWHMWIPLEQGVWKCKDCLLLRAAPSREGLELQGWPR